MNRADIIRRELAPIIRGEGLTAKDQLRVWGLEYRLDVLAEQRRVIEHNLSRTRRRITQFSDSTLRAYLEEDEREYVTLLAKNEEAHRSITQEVATIRSKPLSNKTTNAAAVIVLASVHDLSTGTLVTIAVVCAVVAYIGWQVWRHKSADKAFRSVGRRFRSSPQGEPSVHVEKEHADEDDVYESLEEFDRKYNHNPLYLKLRIDRFLAQSDSEEAIRKFCEDHEFTAIGNRTERDRDDPTKTRIIEGQSITLRIVAMTEEQFSQVPANVRTQWMSERNRRTLEAALRALPQPTATVVTMPAPSNGNGHARAIAQSGTEVKKKRSLGNEPPVGDDE